MTGRSSKFSAYDLCFPNCLKSAKMHNWEPQQQKNVRLLILNSRTILCGLYRYMDENDSIRGLLGVGESTTSNLLIYNLFD